MKNVWIDTLDTYYNSLGTNCFLAEDLHFKLSSVQFTVCIIYMYCTYVWIDKGTRFLLLKYKKIRASPFGRWK